MKSFIRSLWVPIIIIGVLCVPAHATSPNIVISQVYLGTGGRVNAGAGTAATTVTVRPQNEYVE